MVIAVNRIGISLSFFVFTVVWKPTFRTSRLHFLEFLGDRPDRQGDIL